MKTDYKYTIALLFIISFANLQLSAQQTNKNYTFARKALDAGQYSYDMLIKQRNLKPSKPIESQNSENKNIKKESIQLENDNSELFIKELDALMSILNLEPNKETDSPTTTEHPYTEDTSKYLTNPTSYIYSPTDKYRFAISTEKPITYYIEVLQNEEYIPHKFRTIDNEDNKADAYWHDEDTLYYLEQRTSGKRTYSIAYSVKVIER